MKRILTKTFLLMISVYVIGCTKAPSPASITGDSNIARPPVTNPSTSNPADEPPIVKDSNGVFVRQAVTGFSQAATLPLPAVTYHGITN